MKKIIEYLCFLGIIILVLLGLNGLLGSYYRSNHKDDSNYDSTRKQQYQQHIIDNQRTKNMTTKEAMDYYDMSIEERNSKYK